LGEKIPAVHTTLVYLPKDNWPRRRRGLFPPRRTAGAGRRPSSSSLLLCTHACECDCSPSSMGCDAMPCHACTPPLLRLFTLVVFTHAPGPGEAAPPSSSQPHMHCACAQLSRPCVCVPARAYSVHSRPQRPMLYTQSWGPHACIPRLGSS
jgi:hypothetical protein